MGPTIWAICLLPFLFSSVELSAASELDVLYEWKYIDYDWESDVQKQKAIAAGKYVYTNVIPWDLQQIGDRLLVTTPKFKDNPASLSTISSKSGEGGPLLAPYPNWSWHTTDDCSGITSVNRIAVDSCNVLWIVDSGKIGNKQVCPAKILAFDSKTDRLLADVAIPDEISHSPTDPSRGILEVLKVETSGEGCANTWVYIGDPEGYGLLIWNGTNIWRLNDDVFAPTEGPLQLTIAGESITVNLGMAGLSIFPPGFIREDYLLFQPVSVDKCYAASRDQLHASYAGNHVQYYISEIMISGGVMAHDVSPKGVFIGVSADKTTLACWNLQYPLNETYVIPLLTDEETLQAATGVKTTFGSQNGVTGENLWMLTNRLQKFVLGTVDFNDINFRILGGNLDNIVKGTLCEPADHGIVNTIEEKLFFKYDDTSS